MAQYDDRFPYHIKARNIQHGYPGKHYFPVVTNDERAKFLYWIRADLVRIPWSHKLWPFGTLAFYEEDIFVDFIDNEEVQAAETDTLEDVISKADDVRAARLQADVELVRTANAVIDFIQGSGGLRRGGGTLTSLIQWILVMALILSFGVFLAATKYPGPKLIVRSLTKANINLPMGVCAGVPSDPGTMFSAIKVDGYQSLGKLLKQGKCVDGLELVGAKISSVSMPSAILIPDGKEPPGLAGGKADCVKGLKAHPGKMLCTNVGPYEGDASLITDANYWMYAFEPSLASGSTSADTSSDK